MHCASCEILIEKEILAIGGIKSLNIHLQENKIDIESEKEITAVELNQKFKEYGYFFSDKPFKSQLTEFINAFLIFVFIIILFILFMRLGISSFVNVSSESALPVFVIFGFIAGISSCSAFLGSIILALSKRWLFNFGEKNKLDKAKPYLLFSISRILTFAVIGFGFGALGRHIQLSASIASFFVIIISIFMIIIALQMLGIKSLSKFRFSLPKKISNIFESNNYFKSSLLTKIEPLIVGVITVLLPCGFALTTLGFAVLSGDPIRGSLIMGLFALGTSVPLFIIGIFSSKLLSNRNLSNMFAKIIALLIITSVFYNLYSQFGINHYIADLKNGINRFGPSQMIFPINQNISVINIVFTDEYDLQPNSFTISLNQPVRIEIEARDTGYWCRRDVMIPGLWNEPLSLIRGETLVMEFTPTNIGEYLITCGRGSKRGVIQVIE